MKYKCIIFDCDGVLVDSEATSIGVLVDMAKEIGLDLDMEAMMHEFSGQSLQHCFEYIQQRTPKGSVEDWIPEFRRRTYQAFRTDLKAIPGVQDLLKRLNRPRCVASNAPLEKIELNLGLLNMLDFFDGKLFSAYDIQKWKPDPDLFLHAAAQMGFAPHECVVIEDSLTGVQAAKAGGFDVFGYANKNTADKLEAAGAKVFYEMDKLDLLLG